MGQIKPQNTRQINVSQRWFVWFLAVLIRDSDGNVRIWMLWLLFSTTGGSSDTSLFMSKGKHVWWFWNVNFHFLAEHLWVWKLAHRVLLWGPLVENSPSNHLSCHKMCESKGRTRENDSERLLVGLNLDSRRRFGQGKHRSNVKVVNDSVVAFLNTLIQVAAWHNKSVIKLFTQRNQSSVRMWMHSARWTALGSEGLKWAVRSCLQDCDGACRPPVVSRAEVRG